MEDWLYAAGWDRDLVQKNCLGFNRNNKASSRFVGYHLPRKSHRFRPRLLTEVETTNSRRLDEEEAKDTSKEMIKFGGNRALVFLVETSDLKTPQASSLGGSHEILNPKSSENGHVPRNLRLGLMSIDMVQPYVCFQQIEMIASPVVESEDTIDSTQSSSNSGNSHSKSKILEIGKNLIYALSSNHYHLLIVIFCMNRCRCK